MPLAREGVERLCVRSENFADRLPRGSRKDVHVVPGRVEGSAGGPPPGRPPDRRTSRTTPGGTPDHQGHAHPHVRKGPGDQEPRRASPQHDGAPDPGALHQAVGRRVPEVGTSARMRGSDTMSTKKSPCACRRALRVRTAASEAKRSIPLYG